MPINVAEALDSDTAEKITVERSTGDDYVDGLFVKGTTINFNTLASVQQPTPRQLEVLPEGERDNNPRLFITKKALRTSSDTDQTLADIVNFKGQRFKIIAVGDWQSYGHTMTFGVRDQ